jgi:hypothetical protein
MAREVVGCWGVDIHEIDVFLDQNGGVKSLREDGRIMVASFLGQIKHLES